MTKKAWYWLSLLLIASLLFSGCGSPLLEKHPPLKVEWTDWSGDYTLLIAAEKGLFEKYGVEVEPVYYSNFSEATPDMASNKLDAGLFAIGDLLDVSRLVDVKMVGIYDSGGTVAIVSRNEIESVADLAGQKVGVILGSYGEMLVRQMLISAGMSLRDIQLVNMDPSEVISGMTNQSIAAGYVWAPLDQDAVQAGHKVLYTQTADTLAPDVIVFREDVVTERPDDIRAFLNAWFEAVEFRNNNPEEARQIIANATHKPVSSIPLTPDATLYTREDNLKFFSKDLSDQSSIYDMAQSNLNFRISRGDVTIPPDLEDILDPSYLKPSSDLAQ